MRVGKASIRREAVAATGNQIQELYESCQLPVPDGQGGRRTGLNDAQDSM